MKNTVRSAFYFAGTFVLIVHLVGNAGASKSIPLEVSNLPDCGITVQKIDPKKAIHRSNPVATPGGEPEMRIDGRTIPGQWIPSPGSGESYLVSRFPEDLIRRSKQETLSGEIRFRTATPAKSENVPSEEIITETPVFRITQTVKSQGGLPSKIEFKKSGRVLNTLRWHDRLYHPERRCETASSNDVRLALVADGPICRVVRNDVTLKCSDPSFSKDPPRIAYTWFFFKEYPGLIYVSGDYFQSEPDEWRERHFLQLHVPDGSFGAYADPARPAGRIRFEGNKKRFQSKGALLLDAENRIAMFGGAEVAVYDGLNTGYGPYIAANGRSAWIPWSETTGTEATWIYIDSGEMSPVQFASLYDGFNDRGTIRLLHPALDEGAKTWLDTARNVLRYNGVFKTEKEYDDFRPDGKRFVAIRSDRLGMLLEKVESEKEGGIRLVALVDIAAKTLLTPPEPQSLFSLTLRETLPDRKESERPYRIRTISSDKNWTETDIRADAEGYLLSFKGLQSAPNGNDVKLTLRIAARLESPTTEGPWYARSSITLRWAGKPVLPENLRLQSAAMPTLRLAKFAREMKAFYPQGSGVVLDNPFNTSFRWERRYPGAWSTMPWFAVWNDDEDRSRRTGLYIAAHDRAGTTKDFSLRTDSQSGTLRVGVDYPAENPGRTDATFADGTIVLETFRGDWFDAALLYRDWVRREASWYPRDTMGSDGRSDTAFWMRENALWIRGFGMEPAMREKVKKIQQDLGIPVGLHWYHWHGIPFDNDYPHYFPTKPGFKAAVADLQRDGKIFVMPYINGRLWDRRDRGAEDWLFTKRGLAGVTKNEEGNPNFETYRSRESDGSKVELGVMCPHSKVWSDKLQELIGRLAGRSDGKADDEGNIGTRAVYTDQVAAGAPKLCFDPSHGHPLGGGSWWVEGYHDIFKKIRPRFPDGTALATECNAEPFVNCYDAYLAWHFLDQGQVPAFATVYAGAIQVYGRFYPGGADHVPSARLKTAEAFVFGEQLGWIPLDVLENPEIYDSMKKTVLLRYKLREYFYKGEMARAPELSGNMPRVTADWRSFGGPCILTTDAVRTGARRIVEKNSTVLLFANGTDQAQENGLEVNPEEFGFDPDRFRVIRHDSDGSEKVLERLPETIRIGPADVMALELKPSIP